VQREKHRTGIPFILVSKCRFVNPPVFPQSPLRWGLGDFAVRLRPWLCDFLIYSLYVQLLYQTFAQHPYQTKHNRHSIWESVIRIGFFHVLIIGSYWGMIGINGWTIHSAIIATVVCVLEFVLAITVWQLFADGNKDDTMSE
jgi:hypothetical protein